MYFALVARQRDLPEAAYFGPGARKAKGPKFAMNEAMDGVVNVSRRNIPLSGGPTGFDNLILKFTRIAT